MVNRAVFQGLKNKQEKDTGLQSLPRVGLRQTATPTAMLLFALGGVKFPEGFMCSLGVVRVGVTARIAE